MMAISGWQPPSTFEERLKNILVPPRLYAIIRGYRERRGGEREIRLLPFLVDPARNAVDAGANKGVYSYWMARYARHVFAYEPNPKLFRLLVRGMGRNVTVSPVALSDRNGQAELRVPRTSKGYSNQRASLSAEAVGPDYGALTVDARRLDDEGLADVGFIKVDVEGYEFQMLQGVTETIARDRPILLAEIEEHHTKMLLADAVGRIESSFAYRAYFYLRGRLAPFAEIDPIANHGTPASRADYVYNFLFFPEELQESEFHPELRRLLSA